jgi:hypothetical protein
MQGSPSTAAQASVKRNSLCYVSHQKAINPHSPDNALSFGAACAIQI